MKARQFALAPAAEELRAELARTPPHVPCWYFYDERGSELYERITRLPEYYLTRTETAILAQHADDMLGSSAPFGEFVELGSGSSRKTRLLLERAVESGPVVFHPLDVSAAALRSTAEHLAGIDGLTVRGVLGDYRLGLRNLPSPRARRLFLFLGSSIGNYPEERAVRLLRLVRGAMTPRDRLLLGVDLAKDPRVIQLAYDDAAGVTAAFNRNILGRLNREFGADFEPRAWRHRALYAERARRVEMHLEAGSAQRVSIPGLDLFLRFRRGATIHTESSQKYDEASVERIAAASGLRPERWWSDEQGWFAVASLRPA